MSLRPLPPQGAMRRDLVIGVACALVFAILTGRITP